MTRLLRVLAAVDVVSGLALAVAASWFGEQVDLSTTVVRVVGVALVLLGVETYLLRDKPVMARVAMVVEAVAALAALDVLLLADPTGIGVVLLAASALYGVVAALDLVRLTRDRELVAA